MLWCLKCIISSGGHLSLTMYVSLSVAFPLYLVMEQTMTVGSPVNQQSCTVEDRMTILNMHIVLFPGLHYGARSHVHLPYPKESGNKTILNALI